MQRVFIKRVEKYFDSFQFTLIIHYHKDLEINEIFKRMCKNNPDLKEYYCSAIEPGALVIPLMNENAAHLIINGATTIGMLAHESNHIALDAFQKTGTSHTEETDEVFCYLSQHIFEFILQTVLYKFQNPIKNILLF
jgi:hypothetical protein